MSIQEWWKNLSISTDKQGFINTKLFHKLLDKPWNPKQETLTLLEINKRRKQLLDEEE